MTESEKVKKKNQVKVVVKIIIGEDEKVYCIHTLTISW